MRLFLILLGAGFLGGLSAHMGYPVDTWEYWGVVLPYAIATGFIPHKSGELL